MNYTDPSGRKPDSAEVDHLFEGTQYGTAERVMGLSQAILNSAQQYNPPFARLSVDNFAAIMVAVILNEQANHLGMGRGGTFAINIWEMCQWTWEFTDGLHGGNRWLEMTTGRESLSIGLVNFRVGTLREIQRGELPANEEEQRPTVLGGFDFGTKPLSNQLPQGHPDLRVGETSLLFDDTFSVQLLAANHHRALLAMQIAGMSFESLEQTVKSVSAWGNVGIVTPKLIQDNPKARRYGEVTWSKFTRAQNIVALMHQSGGSSSSW